MLMRFLCSLSLVCLIAACAEPPTCETDNGGCAPEAACSVAGEAIVCACNAGYAGDGRTCTDVDECPMMDCGSNTTCRNTPGSAVCECVAGFSQGDGGCVDIDECASNPCQANAACTNTAGSFQCACEPGFRADGAACVDVDECVAGTDDCGEHAACANTEGSFSCTCEAGYAGDGRRCDPSVLAGSARFFGNLDTDYAESIAHCPRRLADGKVVFFSSGDGTGDEPFVIANGTTSLLRDLAPGAAGSYRGCLPGTPGGKVLFFADDGASGTQLWTTDGTAGGTAPVCAPSSGNCPANLQPGAVAFQGKFLIAEDLGPSRKLWSYNPANGGLAPFASGLTATFGFLEQGVEIAGSKLLVCDVDRMLVIASDGSASIVGGADSLSRACASQRSAAPAVLAGQGVYLMRSGAANQYRLTLTEGATASLVSAAYYVSTPDVGVLGGKAYFVGRPITSSENRLMAWDGDPTHAPVEVVATTPSGPVHVTPFQAVPRGQAADARWIVPARRDGSSLLEFYVLSSSGLSWLASTALEPTDYGLDAYDGLTAPGATLSRFRVSRSRAGTTEPGTLWIASDGTSTGTNVFEAGNDMLDASVDAQGFLLSAKVPGSPKGVYAWQPSAPAALALVGAALGPEQGGAPRMLGYANGRWYLARDKEGTTVLAATSGNIETTDILAGPAQGCGFIIGSHAVALNGAFYFVCAARRQSSYTDHSLWRTDGTRQGTTRIMGDPGDVIDGLVGAAGRLFVALRSPSGSSLAAFDPATLRFDRQLAAVQVGALLSEYNGNVYFSGRVSATGDELWRSDGTAAGTTLVADLSLGSPSTSYESLGVIGGKLVMCAKPTSADAGLYAYDGTSAAPSRFFTAAGMRCGGAGGRLSGGRGFVVASSDATGGELLVTDGTVAGTTFLDLAPGTDETSPNDAFVNPLTQRVFFRGSDGAVVESDGTAAGTRKVVPTTAGGVIAEFVVAGRGVLMLVEDASRSASVLEAWEDGVGKVVGVDYGELGAGYFEGLSFAEGRAFVTRNSPAIGEEALLFSMLP